MNPRETQGPVPLVRDRRAWVAALLLVAAAVAVVLGGGDGGRQSVLEEPPGFSLSPEGEDVPRLAPIRVTFERPPEEKDATKILAVEPSVDGTFAWVSERTLLFQPAFPGYLRGHEYRVSVRPQPEAGLFDEYRASFVTEGVLTVESVVPAPGDVEVPANGQVLVQFSRSVAPLTFLSAQPLDEVIAFDPPLPGRGEWLNTSLYRFTPDAIEPSTVYTATIRAGLTSWVDGVLKEDYTWSFTSFGPALDGLTPENNATFASLRQEVNVYFNQPMDPASAERRIAIERVSDGVQVAGTFAWNPENTRVTWRPSANLDYQANYRVRVEAGIASAKGVLTRAGRTATFTTVGLPRVSDTFPHNGETSANRYGISITFSNPMDEATIEGRISVSGFSSEEVEAAWTLWDERNLNIGLTLRPSTTYTVSLAAGITDRYGQPLPPYSFTFTTGRMEPFLTFATPGQVATYMATAEPILYFHSANYTSATFTLYPLTRDEARYLQVRNYIPTEPKSEDFNPSLPPLRRWNETWPAPENEIQLNRTSLSGGGPLPTGDYFVASSTGAELAFSVVDTAIVLKESQTELLAWVVDLATGDPVAGATVNADGEAIEGPHDRQTDANGIARFALKAIDSPYGGRGLDRGVITVRSSGRYGVATMHWQQGFSPWQLNIPFDPWYNRTYVGHIYTDRPIYRPGETLHFKGIVRTDDDAAYTVPPSDAPIRYAIVDSQGTVIDESAVELNEFGSFAIDFELPASAATGNYGIQLMWRPAAVPSYGDIHISGTSFLVAEFRRPEFEVEVTTAADAYAAGDTIAATVDATFFFGGAVRGAKVDWSVVSDPLFPTFEGYEGFSFADSDRFWRFFPSGPSVFRDPVRARGTAVTGADGKAALSVPAEIIGDEGPQRYIISASVLDATGQVVAGSAPVEVHPADGYAGIRTAEWLAERGEPAVIELATVAVDGSPIPRGDVTVRVYERTWVTTKEVTPEGARRYRSEPLDTLVQTLNVATDAAGRGTIAITPTNVGTLRIVAEYVDGRGRIARSSTFLWVYGEGSASWYVSNDDSIDLVPDQERYAVGETASVLVPAPFAGATALVTVERGKVHSAAIERLPGNSTTLTIPITERSVPNVYVSTALYRPPTDADPIPRFKIGYAQLPVSTETRVLNVEIQPDRAQAQPGETVGYDIRVTDSEGRGVRAEVSVAVVDKAVLSLAEERSETGLRAFWFERALGVSTASTLASLIDRTNDVIQEPRQGGKGGGGLDAERLRAEFKNTAFWAAQLTTDADGRLHVDVELPDNLTTWRMQVRAISTDALVGEGTNELLSTIPLLLRPALPRFLRVGDELTLRVLARNATDSPLDVAVAIEAEGIAIEDQTARRATIAPGESVPFTWPAKVEAEGRAKLTFRATSTGPGDALLQELPLWLDVTPETTATGGVVTDKAAQEAVYLPDYAILEGGSLEVAVEATLVGLLGDELEFFEPPTPPYDRDEASDRIAARIMATVAVMRAEESAGLESRLRPRVRTDLAQLLTRQANDGGWLWVPGNTISSPWVTGWALAAIGEAEAAGFHVDDIRVSRARLYVNGYLNRSFDVKYPPSPDEHAFLLWTLANAGEATATLPLARSLFETQRAQLGSDGKAYLLLALAASGQSLASEPVQALLNDLTATVIPSANGNHWEDAPADASRYRGYVSRAAVESTSAVVLALARVDADHPLIEESVRWLMVARGTWAWRGGPVSAIGLTALASFAIGTGELAGDFTYRVTAGGDDVLSGRARAANGDTARTEIPLTDLERGTVTVLEFARDVTARGRLYYRLNLRYLTPAREVEALNRGIAIAHEYTLLGDPQTPVTSAKVGDVVRVTVTVVAPAERNLVVAEDFLPAGLEPIDPNLSTEDEALKRQLAQERIAASSVDTGGWWAPWYWWYYTPFEHASIRDDRVVLTATTLPKGVHTYVYYARATVAGDFFVAPPHIEETRFPEVFGRGDSGRFVVTE